MLLKEMPDDWNRNFHLLLASKEPLRNWANSKGDNAILGVRCGKYACPVRNFLEEKITCNSVTLNHANPDEEEACYVKLPEWVNDLIIRLDTKGPTGHEDIFIRKNEFLKELNALPDPTDS